MGTFATKAADALARTGVRRCKVGRVIDLMDADDLARYHEFIEAIEAQRLTRHELRSLLVQAYDTDMSITSVKDHVGGRCVCSG